VVTIVLLQACNNLFLFVYVFATRTRDTVIVH